MTTIKLAKEEDLTAIGELYQKFYKDKFDFPELKNFLRTFVLHNGDELVLFGGARLVVEIIAMTNKDSTSRVKHDALYKFLYAVEEVSRENSFDQIHAFPEFDSTWRERLKKDGFRPTTYPAYVKDI